MATMAVALDRNLFLAYYSSYWGWLVSQFDEGLWQQWPSPSTEICFWHITALVGEKLTKIIISLFETVLKVSKMIIWQSEAWSRSLDLENGTVFLLQFVNAHMLPNLSQK